MFASLKKAYLPLLPIVLLITAGACKGDPTEPRPSAPSRSVLNGSYTCVGFKAFYQGPAGLGYYRGSCRNYLTISSPTRQDSVETFPFTISPDNAVSRPSFPGVFGMLQYDVPAARARIVYPGRPDDYFDVSAEGGTVLFEQTRVFDFSGDGRADSLFLTFLKSGT
ncbi:MAG: hypothetical protein M3466_07990 [Gemmatimonadota bacterium]|nr:hypothetical protein [Gemmatimonadota bacterium]